MYEGIAIGGDRYPGTTFMDHITRFQANPEIKMIVLLGEVGGVEEYQVCEALKNGSITKPLVAWCIGTCAKMFSYEVCYCVCVCVEKNELLCVVCVCVCLLGANGLFCIYVYIILLPSQPQKNILITMFH